jgi:hypothetical protein
VGCHGAYSNLGRGKQKARAALAQALTAMPATPDPTQAWPQSAALGRRWACLIRRIHEVYACSAPAAARSCAWSRSSSSPARSAAFSATLPTAPKRAERHHPHSPSRPQRRTAPLRPDTAAPRRGRYPFSAAQARGSPEHSSRPGLERAAAGRHRLPWAHASGVVCAAFSSHCPPRALPLEIKLSIFSQMP